MATGQPGTQVRAARVCCAALVLCACVAARDVDSPRSYSIGVGARATALGGNNLALAQDFSAVQYNPAGLGFMHAREAHVSMNGLIVQNATDGGLETRESSLERLRLGSGGLVWAVPASRGGLAFAVGYQCPTVFDDVIDYRASAGLTKDEFTLRTQGHFNYYTLGMGLQLAPGLSAGVAASVVGGNLEVHSRRHYTVGGVVPDTAIRESDYEHSLQRSYLGYDIRMGFLYQFSDMLSLGVRFVLPRTVRFSGDWERSYPLLLSDSSDYYDDPGRLRYMYEGALGVAVKFPFVVLTPEAGFRGPNPSAEEGTDAANWKVGAGVGAEVPVARTGLLVRLGYRYDEYDDQPAATFYGEDEKPTTLGELPTVLRDQQTLSGGLAYVTKGALCFELSYAYRMWQTRRTGIEHAYGAHQALACISLRY